jgi:acetylornithine deacetylase
MSQEKGRILEDAQAGDPVALARALVATPSVNPEIPNDSPLVAGLLAACAAEGVDPMLAGMTAWVDAALLNQAGTPAVCFGPGSIAQAHSTDEWIDPSEIVTCAAVLERFSYDFLQGDRGEMVTDVFTEAG